MGAIVSGVSVGESVRDRHRPIAGDGQNPDELQQVGAVVFGEAERDHRGRFPVPGCAVRVGIEAAEGVLNSLCEVYPSLKG